MGANKREFTEQRELAMLDQLAQQELQDSALVEAGHNYDFVESYQTIFAKVERGELEALQGFALLKEMEKDFKQKLEILHCLAVEESELYGKSFEHNGYKFERRNGRAIYDFKGISDWEEIDQKEKEIKAKKKEKEQLYKQAFDVWKKSMNRLVNEDTGEVVPMPKVKYTGDVLIVKPLS